MTGARVERLGGRAWLDGATGTEREARAADLEALERLCAETFPGAGFSVREELERPWGRVWLARDEATRAAVGYLVAWHVADEIHVLQVATAERARRRGVGAALVGEALAYAATSRVRILVLEVRRSNDAAIGLYRKLGFAVLGVRKGYYGDTGEDAVEMMLALDPATGLVAPAADREELAP